jgi:hypothetical protein
MDISSPRVIALSSGTFEPPVKKTKGEKILKQQKE